MLIPIEHHAIGELTSAVIDSAVHHAGKLLSQVETIVGCPIGTGRCIGRVVIPKLLCAVAIPVWPNGDMLVAVAGACE